MDNSSPPSLYREMGLFDAINLVAGGMIGSGIFIVSADIARNVQAPGWLLLVWLLAGILTIIGALAYAELAAMLPLAGGQYIYLREAYSPLYGFLFGWTMFTVIQTGSIAAVAVAFTAFLGLIWPWVMEADHALSWQISHQQLMAIGIIIALTWWNSRGLRFGRLLTNVFTVTKILALLALIVIGISWGLRQPTTLTQNLAGWWGSSVLSWDFLPLLGSAMVGALFALDGWANVTFVAAETKRPRFTLPVSLILGTGLVTLLYLLLNYAYLNVLPLTGSVEGNTVLARGVQHALDDRVGTAVAQLVFGNSGAYGMAIIILISMFGCLNGMILSGPRLYFAMANDGLFFRAAKQLNAAGVPAYALWLQCGWSALLTLSGNYSNLLDYVIFATLLFYVLAIIGLFILRRTQPDMDRPYRVWGYPWLPFLYILLSGAILLDLLLMKPTYTWPGLLIVLSGVPVFWFWRRK
jgi:basic amino acid/polyamine antiporter, APA family